MRKLQELVAEMERAGGLSRLYEISTQLQQEATLTSHTEGLPPASRLHLDNLQRWLTHQQEGIRTLIEVSKTDLKDLSIACDLAKGG